MAKNTEKNLQLFRELISCSHNVYYWKFDSRQECVFTTCSDESMMLKLMFAMDNDKSAALQMMHHSGHPIVMTGSLGFLWITDIEYGVNSEHLYTHVIGPVFVENVSYQSLEIQLQQEDISMTGKRDFTHLLDNLPVIPLTRFLEYGSMMHYCITNEKLNISQFEYASSQRKPKNDVPAYKKAHDTWAMEQKLLKLIEEGNLDFKEQ